MLFGRDNFAGCLIAAIRFGDLGRTSNMFFVVGFLSCNFRSCLDILTQLLSINLDDENTVGPGRSVILGSLTDNPICVADEEQVQRVFLVLGSMHAQVAHGELTVRVL